MAIAPAKEVNDNKLQNSLCEPVHGTTAISNEREYRKALGAYSTGVAIVTARAKDNTPVGMTVNSFSSVSLNPPLVLWSVAKKAYGRTVFEKASYWAVHILSEKQEQLALRFAKAGEDKFRDLSPRNGIGEVPLLSGCCVRLQCANRVAYEGGDHIILVGEVLQFDRLDREPLILSGGAFVKARPNKKGGGVSCGREIQDELLSHLLSGV